MDRNDFFTQLIGILEANGEGNSDISYYTNGDATAEDYRNIIRVAFERTAPGSPERQAFIDLMSEGGFWAETDNLNYWLDADATDEGNLNDLMNAAEERLPRIGDGTDPVTGEFADDDTIMPEGADGELGGILSGGQTMRITREGQPDIVVQVYEWPTGSGQYTYFQFDSLDQAKAVLGDAFNIDGTHDETWLRTNANNGGSASEVIGMEGTFEKMMDDIIYESARAAGISDPTILGQYLQDEEIQKIIGDAAIGDWTEAQTTAAIRQTSFYTEVLYPGIDNYYGRTSNPEAAYALYTQNVTANLYQLGVEADPDGSYKSTIGDLLDSGVSDTALATFTPNYVRATSNDDYRNEMNRWLSAANMPTIDDFDSFFELLAGNAPAEINEVVEMATISYVADNVGLQFTDEIFREVAAETDYSEGALQQIFTDVDRALFALGESGLNNYGLSSADILRAKAGYAMEGKTPAETSALINKVITEQGLSDDPTAKFFTDYNNEGAPIKAGLRASVDEGA